MNPHRFVALAVVLAIVGCSPGAQPTIDSGPPADSSSHGTDARTALDTSSADATDTLAPMDTAPAVDAIVDAQAADVYFDPGMCGQSVRDCLCGCNGSAVCQNACIQGDIDCSGCMLFAAEQCCPGQWTAFDTCDTDNNCMDDANCLTTHCTPEFNAFNMCFATAQRSDAMCQMQVQMCLGPDYPTIHCIQTM